MKPTNLNTDFTLIRITLWCNSVLQTKEDTHEYFSKLNPETLQALQKDTFIQSFQLKQNEPEINPLTPSKSSPSKSSPSKSSPSSPSKSTASLTKKRKSASQKSDLVKQFLINNNPKKFNNSSFQNSNPKNNNQKFNTIVANIKQNLAHINSGHTKYTFMKFSLSENLYILSKQWDVEKVFYLAPRC